ncbi:MAG: TetR/AcrR family transcriptional regulator [Planctomycetia bacterium]|nr:TetR/AcrR family transcriptional regulator [Planctomycetia bacterium]
MTVYVDHNQRRVVILERAFELFAQEGFAGVTYQKIANQCGISRTTIYKYFKDKDQIFVYAIKQSTDKLSNAMRKVVDRHDYSAVRKIKHVLHLTVNLLTNNRVFLSVVLDYLTSLKYSGADVRRKARPRTFGIRFLLTKLVADAIAENDFDQGNPDQIAARLYCILESYVLNLTVTDTMDRRECLALIDSYIEDCKRRL